MITCEIDGIWCPKCRELHPTLMWHEKYNDYELNRKERFEENKRKRPNLFKDAKYVDNLYIKELEEMKEQGNCIVCNDLTYFKDLKLGNYVCSDECKYKNRENKKDML